MIKFNIKALRLAANMKKSELVERSGIREGTLTDYEYSRATTIRIEYIDKLCEVFQCQPSDLMTYIPNNSSALCFPDKISTVRDTLKKKEIDIESELTNLEYRIKILESALNAKNQVIEQMFEYLEKRNKEKADESKHL